MRSRLMVAVVSVFGTLAVCAGVAYCFYPRQEKKPVIVPEQPVAEVMKGFQPAVPEKDKIGLRRIHLKFPESWKVDLGIEKLYFLRDEEQKSPSSQQPKLELVDEAGGKWRVGVSEYMRQRPGLEIDRKTVIISPQSAYNASIEFGAEADREKLLPKPKDLQHLYAVFDDAENLAVHRLLAISIRIGYWNQKTVQSARFMVLGCASDKPWPQEEDGPKTHLEKIAEFELPLDIYADAAGEIFLHIFSNEKDAERYVAETKAHREKFKR